MSATESLWSATCSRPNYPPLTAKGLHVDVAVVGGGITGVTAAFLLQQAGKRVALLEASGVGTGVTAGTTAHLTQVLDTRFHQLERKFGREAASLVAESGAVAIDRIQALVDGCKVECGFERLPGYLFAARREQADELAEELAACERLGLHCERALPPPPIPGRVALRFDGQAQFHVLRYLLPLAMRFRNAGGEVYEATRVVQIDDGEPCRVCVASGLELTADRVIVATHVPLSRVALQARLAPYRSYVVSGPVALGPHGLFWDLEDPYHYVRSFHLEGETHLLVGGEDHKTGQEHDTASRFQRLEDYAADLGLVHVTHSWSAQVIEPSDGLPFIGRQPGSSRVFVATGFSGNGMTFGTLSAMILADACLGKPNPFAELYSPRRIRSLATLNVDYPLHLLKDALRRPDVASLDDIERGRGAIAPVGGARLAVYRDETGALHALSSVCTHLGCRVVFNDVEKTWDCPCHGSRFSLDGAVVNGPAVKPLERKELSGARRELHSGEARR